MLSPKFIGVDMFWMLVELWATLVGLGLIWLAFWVIYEGFRALLFDR